MAVAIVDVLEQVDVEEADHQRAALTVNLCQVTGQLLQSCAPVGQPGQAIGLGQLAQRPSSAARSPPAAAPPPGTPATIRLHWRRR
ncbi:hypothetical protein G6F55_014537 [Rhizopus delemar]|nr:hypothetical protein G6F55_014537 [Rhizopus delemar]